MKFKLSILSLFVITASLIYAKPKMLTEPKSNEVTLVGKIHFTMDVDKEWLFDAFDVPKDKRGYKDLYVMPFFPPEATIGEENAFQKVVKSKDVEKFNENAWGANGDYFFATYKLNSERTIYLTHVIVFIGGSYMIPIMLPMNIKIKVPEGEKFLYVGDYFYSAKGINYEITVSKSDNLESAQKALNQVTNKEYTISRATAQPYDGNKEGGIKYYHEFYNIKKEDWYKIYDKLPVIEK